MTPGSKAEHLDRALDLLLAGSRPAADRAIEPLLDVADLVRAAMPPIPVADAFDARLLERIGGERRMPAAVGTLERIARRELRSPGRILAAGAVSSAAVGVTVTALAVWRSRRHSAGLLPAGRK